MYTTSTYETNQLMSNSDNIHNSASLHTKFIQPKMKTPNNYPESKKSLQETLSDLVSLKDTNSVYAQTRKQYIEGKLEELKLSDLKLKANKKHQLKHTKSIDLGRSDNINLNILKKDDITNRLRCTWIKLNGMVETLVDTGASHMFIQKDLIKDIPKNLIVKYKKYVSGMTTAGGELKQNISAKITLLVGCIIDNGQQLQMPIEFLVAECLNGWSTILGESFLGHPDLKTNISTEYINLNWNNTIYHILLYYSKPHRAAGYILNTERIIIEPQAVKWLKVNTTIKQTDTDGLIDEDPLVRNNILVYPSLVSLLDNKVTIMIKNELNEPITIPENQNIGLVYFKDPMPNTVMSMNKFVNIMNGEQIEEEDRLSVHTVKAFNDKIQSFGNNNMSNENDPYENEIQKLLNTHPDTFYHENASDEFTEHLTYFKFV